ncbi:hypothetical protein JTE90_020158, partial [Oedothorax gibbosus]
YRLVKEEMSLLSLQEKHWESAAKWDTTPHTAHRTTQKDLCEALHSYISGVRDQGCVPALHSVTHPHGGAPENAVLISQGGGTPGVPRVEWAHPDTELQAGDRLLEVNGHLVIGRDPGDVGRVLSRPLRRAVFLRPTSGAQRGGGPRETSNLRQELTAVVSRLNSEMADKAKMAAQNKRIQTDCNDLKTQNRKLKLQVFSLQSILLCLFQSLEKTQYPNVLLKAESPVLEVLRNMTLDEHWSAALKDVLSTKKSIPWLELKPQVLDLDSAKECESEELR